MRLLSNAPINGMSHTLPSYSQVGGVGHTIDWCIRERATLQVNAQLHNCMLDSLVPRHQIFRARPAALSQGAREKLVSGDETTCLVEHMRGEITSCIRLTIVLVD